jgi:hypothetical protein
VRGLALRLTNNSLAMDQSNCSQSAGLELAEQESSCTAVNSAEDVRNTAKENGGGQVGGMHGEEGHGGANGSLQSRFTVRHDPLEKGREGCNLRWRYLNVLRVSWGPS